MTALLNMASVINDCAAIDQTTILDHNICINRSIRQDHDTFANPCSFGNIGCLVDKDRNIAIIIHKSMNP